MYFVGQILKAVAPSTALSTPMPDAATTGFCMTRVAKWNEFYARRRGIARRTDALRAAHPRSWTFM